MKKWIIAALSLSVSSQVFSWGMTGHRVTGAIAEQYLSADAKAAISKILPGEDLAEASTYADEMRSHPSTFWKKTASPWHYVNVYEGAHYADKPAPAEGDAITALAVFSKQLKDPASSLAEKQLALRFIVHLVGDLHQPLHTGTDKDRGGNTIKVNFFWQDSNLHSVWDSGLIDREQLSYSEWTARLSRKISPEQAEAWQEIDPEVWVAESAKVRAGVYPTKNKLSYDYQFQSMPIIKQQLQKAGVRLAAYLNEIFEY